MFDSTFTSQMVILEPLFLGQSYIYCKNKNAGLLQTV